ncbi:MAG TPA: 50S ribosomal protein L13 [Candidatus Cloacimonadota bacterium]|nr:50S ribosomal protein L13 [Candidatus Cloacimonadota bacterium]HOQ80255.1 50S ribosomal protein L13 [Candidatus Cloacimonadota bacterium]HPK41710.1 50S ribosomal protein L13 [Candidatus Cloacimonadota bacterium]
MKTFTPRPSEIDQQWYIIDATDKTLGRISTQVAAILRGKNKPYFTPNIDTGDYVVIINADKVAVTGSKALQKVYKSFSGYPGGLREVSFKRMVAKKPEEIIIHSVKGMLPKNVLGRQMIKKLKVYAGSEHPHTAQKPTTLS